MHYLKRAIGGVVWFFDLDDGRGNPAFSKLVTLALLVIVGRMLWVADIAQFGPSAFAAVLAILSAAFGRSMLLRFLERNTMTTTQSATVTADLTKITEAVLKGRDHEKGIDPA